MAQDTESRSLDKVIVRLPDGMRDRLKEAASDSKRSMNAEIVDRLEQTFSLDAHFNEAGDRLLILDAPLAARIRDAALQNKRDFEDEVNHALEAAFPIPTFSFDWFNEHWVARILVAPRDEWDIFIEQANAVLQAHDERWSIWADGTTADGHPRISYGMKTAANE